MRQRLLTTSLLIGLTFAAGGPGLLAGDGPVPAPRFDGIDYSRPDAHLALSPRVGDPTWLRSLAGQLGRETPQDTLAAISQWMHRNLRYEEQAAYGWRTLDEMLKARTYGGCADHAAVLGTLARAAGIPTVWVKTMDLDWIEDFRAGRPEAQRYRGHVFLEVFLGQRWHLLDAQAMRLYEGPYRPSETRILPGGRFAYDKGDDPFALVLSCRWEAWKEQTDTYFRDLDPALLPGGRHRDLLAPWRVWITGNAPLYRYAEQACERLGYHVEKTFNTNWEQNLERARGHVLVVTCDGTRPVLPEAAWSRWLPPGWETSVGAGRPPEEGYVAKRHPDGTRVLLVPGQDLTSVQVGVARGLAASPR